MTYYFFKAVMWTAYELGLWYVFIKPVFFNDSSPRDT